MVAKVARTEVRIHDKGKAARMAAKDKRKAAKETTELVGRVEKQDTVQRGVEKGQTVVCH